jgi:hypothetical protein
LAAFVLLGVKILVNVGEFSKGLLAYQEFPQNHAVPTQILLEIRDSKKIILLIKNIYLINSKIINGRALAATFS